MSSNRYTIQNHTPDQIDALGAFIERYKNACPDAKLLSAGFYTYHPGAENGQNVFLALDAGGQVRGFAPLFAAPVTEESEPGDPHHIWMILLADPVVKDGLIVRDLLLEKVMELGAAMAASFPSSRPTRLATDMMVSQQADIDYLKQKGFEHYDGMYVMQHTLADPVPDQALPAELTLRYWKIASEEERRQYLHAFNTAFPANPRTLETLKFVLDSPSWQTGTAVAAFKGQNELVASILVYLNESNSYGITDDVFVLPEWRGRGIAKALIAKGLGFLRAQNCLQVTLEVMQQNQPAISVYQAMGYKIINHEVFLGRFLET